jgi:alpha,alpha-trehalase
MSFQPIGDYGLLSDCNGAALVGRNGSIDWLCFPRFDGPSVFAGLLDEDGGRWLIRPVAEAQITRHYLPGTMTLETRFKTESGELVLVDALATGPNEEPHGHALGAFAPHLLIRELRCVSGEVLVEFFYYPKPEYGLIACLLHPVDGGIVARGGATKLVLSCDLTCESNPSFLRTRFLLGPGDCRRFGLHYAPSTHPEPKTLSQEQLGEELQTTAKAWRHWSNMHQSYQGPWADLVHHSGRVLQGLTYFPTGAILAAPTTSLPEEVGGQRNWDYRYTWVRDASFTLDALWVSACPDEAYKFIDFLAAAAFTRLQAGHPMQVMYGIGGEHDLSERELAHLSGWRCSAPVRVGNQAWHQEQRDVYGELLAAVHQLQDYLQGIDPLSKRFLIDVADAAGRDWHLPDHGIWEIRGDTRQYLHSKLMCWVALDRALKMADWLGANDEHVERWKQTRSEIREAILDRGWNSDVHAFTQSFDDTALDAASLVIPMVGFLPGDHPKVLATIDAVEEHLTDRRGLVYRYLKDDGLGGQEGSFLLCTFWLAQVRALAGQVDRACEIFERAAAFATDLGLLSEQVDSGSGELLGNFPQAFSHIGLVNAAWAIDQAMAAR